MVARRRDIRLQAREPDALGVGLVVGVRVVLHEDLHVDRWVASAHADPERGRSLVPLLGGLAEYDKCGPGLLAAADRGVGVVGRRGAEGQVRRAVAVDVAERRHGEAEAVLLVGASDPDRALAEFGEVEVRRCAALAPHDIRGARVALGQRLREEARDRDVVDAVAVEVAGPRGVEAGLVLLVDPRYAEAARTEVLEVDRLGVALAEHDVRDAHVQAIARVGEVRADDDVGTRVAVDVADRLDRLADEVAVGGTLRTRPGAGHAARHRVPVGAEPLEVHDPRLRASPHHVREALRQRPRRYAAAAARRCDQHLGPAVAVEVGD